MKRFLALIIGGTLILGSMVGCGAQDSKVELNQEQKVESGIKARVKVNIRGEIIEVADGKVKLDNGQWVIINKDTRFKDDPDNGVEEVNNNLEVGNLIQGYTSDDTQKDTVVAVSIISNVTPMKGPIRAKVLVNISGEIVSVDGNKVQLDNGKWVIIDKDTRFEDDPDNGTKAVNSELVVGNRIQGYTDDDVDSDTVKALAIYSNRPSE